MSIPVDKGIPVPDDNRRGRLAIYPWKTMEVGDSFFIEAKAGEKLGTIQRRLSACAACYHKSSGHRYTTRQVDGGCRVCFGPNKGELVL